MKIKIEKTIIGLDLSFSKQVYFNYLLEIDELKIYFREKQPPKVKT